MKTELTYLQEELAKLHPNTTLTVKTLMMLINKSFEKKAKDEENIINSMEEWHNM